MELLPFWDILNCLTAWCCLTHPIHYIHWRSTLAIGESWHWVESLQCWCSCYADNIVLLAPSPSALWLMFHTCSEFAKSHFLTLKTQLIKFSSSLSASTAEFVFYGQKLAFCESVSHLGHTLYQDLSDDADIVSIKKDMCRKANYMLYSFAPCDPLTKSQLLQS